jgi:hypothetical protein
MNTRPDTPPMAIWVNDKHTPDADAPMAIPVSEGTPGADAPMAILLAVRHFFLPYPKES